MKAIDLFAGAGGFTEGARAAGLEVVWAANHWRAAVDIHAANHPEAIHLCQDLHQADWTTVPDHDALLASPCCQGHTKSRGKERPHHDRQRSTAWAVVSCAEMHRPEIILVENVTEFMDWTLFPAWCAALAALGYSLAPHVIDAADHGVPQHRVRAFIVGTRSASPLVLDLPRRDHVPVSSIIDFAAGRWSPIDKPGRAAATLARIAAGRKQHGARFIAPYYGSGSGLGGRSLARPIGTITTRDRWAVIDGDRMRMVSTDEYRKAMGFPEGYLLPRVKKAAVNMLGNAVVPVAVTDILTEIRKRA